MILLDRKKCEQFLNRFWYGGLTFWHFLLIPFSELYRWIVSLRRFFYRKFYKHSSLKVPVIVVGNLTVGGTGKTPFVIWLSQYLLEKGFHVGIISRGYGSQSKHFPLEITPSTDPELSGDESLILARRTDCPVVISPNRVEALKTLLKNHDVDIVISDDGLQHYPLKRTIEIVIVDGERGFGNQCCLPMGPLREPLSRLDSVDFMVINQNIHEGKIHEWLQKFEAMIQQQNIYEMTIAGTQYINIAIPELNVSNEDFAGQPIHAVAGIGNPRKFFDLLVLNGLAVLAHEFPDHYVYTEKDFHFNEEKDNKIIMTEKDAVKCEKFADYRFWYLPISAQISSQLGDEIVKSLQGWNENS